MTDTFSPAAAPLAERLLPQAREILARYPVGRERSALLPLLHLVQAVDGHVSPAGVTFCAELLGINKAQVGAVATFYTMYKRRPTGEYLVSVCTNTLCNVMGGQEVYDALVEHLGVGHDETTADGRITLEHAECLAACDYAPVLTVNYDFYDNVTPDAAVGLTERLRAGERPTPTRGASLCSLRDMAVQLAGFADERDGAVAEGPAGAPTLRGVTLAQQHGVAVADYDPETPIPQTKPAPGKPAGKEAAGTTPTGTTAAGRGAGERKPAGAARRLADTVKAAAAAVTNRGTDTEKASPTAKPGEKSAAGAASTTRDVKAGDVKDPEVRAAESRVPDGSTSAPDSPGTGVPDGGPAPATSDAQAAQAAGVAANPTAGDGKPADDNALPQERNLSAASGGTRRGDTAEEEAAQ